MFFRFLPFEAPTSFCFKDPDTGREFRESSKKALIQRITAYRRQNNLETIEHLDFVLESYWCTLPENSGKCGPVNLRRGFMGYLKGGVSLLRDVTYQRYAGKDIAEARAKTCAGCVHNVFPDKEGFLKWSDELAYHALGGRTTSLDKDLGSCEICSCPLRVKVHSGEPDSGVDGLQDKFPDFCWQKIRGFRK